MIHRFDNKLEMLTWMAGFFILCLISVFTDSTVVYIIMGIWLAVSALTAPLSFEIWKILRRIVLSIIRRIKER